MWSVDYWLHEAYSGWAGERVSNSLIFNHRWEISPETNGILSNGITNIRWKSFRFRLFDSENQLQRSIKLRDDLNNRANGIYLLGTIFYRQFSSEFFPKMFQNKQQQQKLAFIPLFWIFHNGKNGQMGDRKSSADAAHPFNVHKTNNKTKLLLNWFICMNNIILRQIQKQNSSLMSL